MKIASKFYEDKQLDKEQIKELGLEVIYEIPCKSIERTDQKYNKLVNIVEEKCINKHIWVLWGNINEKQWKAIQVASVINENNDVRREIKRDFNRMLEYDESVDLRAWKSYFYGEVLKVKEKCDVICQKYQSIKESFEKLMVTVYSDEDNLGECPNEIISKYQVCEIELAEKIKPIIWNPSPKEKQYLKKR